MVCHIRVIITDFEVRVIPLKTLSKSQINVRTLTISVRITTRSTLLNGVLWDEVAQKRFRAKFFQHISGKHLPVQSQQ